LLSLRGIKAINPYTLEAGPDLDALLHQRFFGDKNSSKSVPAYSTDVSASAKLRSRVASVFGHNIVTGETRMRPRRYFARYESDPSTATEVLADDEPLAICRLAVLLMNRE
jgi:hypothetical protein